MKFFDPKPEYEACREAIDQAMRAVIERTSFIHGPEVVQFEESVVNYLNFVQQGHAVAVSSGTDALALALDAANIGRSDEVITTPFTFIATIETIVQVGATPVFVDIDPATFNLDLKAWASKITPATKAVVPVHLFGQAVKMDQLVREAEQYQICVIEDAAQAMGAMCQGRQVGTWGAMGCFSFFPSKNLGGFGDAGLVSCQSEEHAIKVKALRVHGSYVKYEHHDWGYNSRMDTLQAAVLIEKLKHLDVWIKQRQANATYYLEQLEGCGDLVLPQTAESCTHTYNQFSVRTMRRDALHSYLKEKGVPSMIYYPKPLHFQPVMKAMGCGEGDFPVSEQVSHEILSLPIYPYFTRDEQEKVIQAIQTFFEG